MRVTERLLAEVIALGLAQQSSSETGFSIALTESGRAAMTQIVAASKTAETQAKLKLEVSEVAQLRGLLMKLIGAAPEAPLIQQEIHIPPFTLVSLSATTQLS